MEEIKQEWESFKKCTCSTFRDKCSNCMPQEEIADWWLKKLDLAVSKERERVTEAVERAMKYTNWSHSVGSHSDDRGGDSDIECTCMEKEIRYKEEAYKNVLNLINTK